MTQIIMIKDDFFNGEIVFVNMDLSINYDKYEKKIIYKFYDYKFDLL